MYLFVIANVVTSYNIAVKNVRTQYRSGAEIIRKHYRDSRELRAAMTPKLSPWIKWRPIWLIHTLPLPSLTDEDGFHDGFLAFRCQKKYCQKCDQSNKIFQYAMDESFRYGAVLSNDLFFYLCQSAQNVDQIAKLLLPDTYQIVPCKNMYSVCAIDESILDCLVDYFDDEEVVRMRAAVIPSP